MSVASRFTSAAVAFGRIAVAGRTLADSAIAVLLAPACAACAGALDQPTRGPVCDACWLAVSRISVPLCNSCGDPLPASRPLGLESTRCPRCRVEGGCVSFGRALGEYEGALRAIVHALKYGGRRSLAPRLAVLLARCAPEVLDGANVVVPVPLHRVKERARGFNQAELVARQLPLPMALALKRVRRSPSQTGLPAAERRANVRGAFALTDRRIIENAVVVLVDDVSTTGATLEACARVLLDGGAREVRALTVARVASRSR